MRGVSVIDRLIFPSATKKCSSNNNCLLRQEVLYDLRLAGFESYSVCGPAVAGRSRRGGRALCLAVNMAGMTARVTFEYAAGNDDELTLNIGDIITDIREDEEGWLAGTLNGKRGVFPDNFVKVEPAAAAAPAVPAAPSVAAVPAAVTPQSLTGRTNKKRRYCKVTFGYAAAADDELSLNVGEIVEIVCDDEEGWYRGLKPDGSKGVFPNNFAQEISAEEATAGKSDSAGAGNTGGARMGPPAAAATGAALKKPMHPPTPAADSSKSVKRAKVLHSYEQQADDELTLKEGDIIEILSTDISEGWWEGKLGTKVGVFPDNFVALIPNAAEPSESKPPPAMPPAKPTGPHLPARPKPASKSEKPPPPAAAKPPAKVPKKPVKEPTKSPEIQRSKKSPEEKRSIFPKRPTITRPRANTLEGKKSADAADGDGLSLEVTSKPLTHITQNRAGRRHGQRPPSRFTNRASMPPSMMDRHEVMAGGVQNESGGHLDVSTPSQPAHFRRTSPSKSKLATGSVEPARTAPTGTVVLGVLQDLQAEVAQLQSRMAELERKWRSEMKRLNAELQDERRGSKAMRVELDRVRKAQPRLRLT
ncbi:SH3 domain-containing kinase-binding protein 1-like isoform X2 [Sycon ciliatum]|uniref:SH3 domain-containing kinase-binding protein 1-like isoform X2 n=1 Tax=Sycon ciliatum TaxID=27933 RepID=UPI0031F682AE